MQVRFAFSCVKIGTILEAMEEQCTPKIHENGTSQSGPKGDSTLGTSTLVSGASQRRSGATDDYKCLTGGKV